MGSRGIAVVFGGARWAAALAAPLLLAGSGSAMSGPSLAPAGWDSAIKLAEAADRNPDARTVEIELEARVARVEVAPGKHVEAWTYDGRLPGPLIRTRVGDRLIVRFTNHLPQPTTIHWHGVRVPIEMDGVPEISQPEVKTGESFTYDFVLRDAGLFWYHPHVMSAAQVGFGLYGALLVEDPSEAEKLGVKDELTLVLSDIGFDDKGTLEPEDSGGPAGTAFGREGAYVLVNGRVAPSLRARSGAPQRWRVVNTAKSRFFVLFLEGQSFTVIGGDGGLQEYPESTPMALITPGERLDLIVSPRGEPGSQLVLRSMLYNRGYGSVEYRSVEHLATINFTDEKPLPERPAPKVTRVITPPQAKGATPVSMELTQTPADANGVSEFHINGEPYWKAKPFRAELGETQIWAVKNDTKWDHPYHLHGFFFIVLDERGEPVRPLAWKDTVNVPMESTLRLLVRFDERPGTWMIHCHILDHAEGGLMGVVQVGPGGSDKAPVHHGKHR